MMRSKLMFAACGMILVLVPAVAQGQRRTARPKAIEIRGQVPTPQVVTVRPREVPAYSRQVISPTFYNHDFWPSILPAYLLVPQRMITGTAPMDSLMLRGDGPVPMGTTPASPAGMPGTTPPPDSTRPPSGTPPARTQR